MVAKEFEGIGLQEMPALFPAVIRPQAILLHVQQLRLNPVAQHKLLVARELVQLRDQVNQQVLQFGQNVIALGHVNLTKNNFIAARGWFCLPNFQHDSPRSGSKSIKRKRTKIKAPSHNGTQRS